MSIKILNNDVWRHIQTFININPLLMCSRYFYSLKEELYYFNFNKKHSLLYLNNEEPFKSFKIAKPLIQVHLNLSSESLNKDEIIQIISNCNSLDLSCCLNVNPILKHLTKVKCLDLSFTNVRDVYHLKNASFLNLSCTPVYDVSSLVDVKKLILKDCKNV